jgi:hypothetical protein
MLLIDLNSRAAQNFFGSDAGKKVDRKFFTICKFHAWLRTLAKLPRTIRNIIDARRSGRQQTGEQP